MACCDPGPAGNAGSGVARSPCGSHRAIPIRALPRSQASRTPTPMQLGARLGGDFGIYCGEGLLDPIHLGAAALRHVVLAAAATIDGGQCRL